MGQETPLSRALRDRFTKAEPGLGWSLVCLFTLLACLMAVAWLIERWQQRRSTPMALEPMSLYLRVQRKIGLPLMDQWRLWRLAKASETEHPTALLISARLYDEAVEHYCRSHGWWGDRTAAAPRFASIRKRLF